MIWTKDAGERGGHLVLPIVLTLAQLILNSVCPCVMVSLYGNHSKAVAVSANAIATLAGPIC